MASPAEPKHFRSFPRRAVKLRATVAQATAGWQRDATVQNLGLGGASVALRGTLTPGDAVVVSFFAPSLWDPLALPARVAWVRPSKDSGGVTAGLAFEPKDPSVVFALFELVSAMG